MPRVQLRIGVVPVLLIFFTPALTAQLYELPFEEIINRSTIVLEGKVLARESFWDNPRQNIFTSNTVLVSRIFKGATVATDTLKVITWGGAVGNELHVVSESVQYRPGDSGLFCLIPFTQDIPVVGIWENYGSPHGFFRYNLAGNRVEHPFHSFAGITAFRERIRQLAGDQEVLRPDQDFEPQPNDRATPVISSFSPTSLSAGTGSTLTINGSNFGANPGGNGTVRFFNSNANNSRFDVDAVDLISWSDNEIVVEVPSVTAAPGNTAGTGTIQVRNNSNETGTSSGTLTVEFAHTNLEDAGTKYGPRQVDINGDGGLTFTLSTTICDNQDATNAFGRTLRAWRCASGINWQTATTTTSVNSSTDDNINIVTFDVGTPLPGGILGRTTSRYIGCFTGGGLHWYVKEIDVNINNDYTWYYCDDPNPNNMPSNSFDFQSVAFHELGHGHQLGHIIDPSAVMHYAIASKTVKRTLTANEEAGAAYTLSLSANPCGPDPMTLIDPVNCTNITLPADCDDAGTCTLALPVELTSFTGTARQTAIVLEWQTVSEHNNAYFSLERSADAVQFAELRRVPGALHSTELKTYRYVDTRPYPGLNYYRLRQTDLDGSENLLGIIAVAFDSGLKDAVQVFPNPVSSEALYIHTHAIAAGEQLDVVLTDLSGQLIRQKRLEVTGAPVPFPVNDLSPGSYLLFIANPSTRQLANQTLVIRQ